MVKYRLIGTGKTGTDGIATCNNALEGTGAGILNIVASTDSEITADSLIATLQVTDALFHYEGLGNTEDSSFGYATSQISVTTEDDGTIIQNIDTVHHRFVSARINGASTNYCYSDNVTVDFDIVSRTGTTYFVIATQDATNVYSRWIGVSDVHVQVKYENGLVYWNVDGSEDANPTSITFSDDFAIRFELNSGAILKFKNFIVKRC